MSTINKRNILLICLILIFIVVVLLVMLLKLVQNEPELLKQTFSSAVLKGSSNTEEENDETKESQNEQKEEKELTIYNSSEELIELNSASWGYQKTNIKGEYEVDGNNYYYQGFTLVREKNMITKIIFNKDYNDEIVTGLYVGIDFDEVKSALGEPIFENTENNMLGYVTQNLFICVYEDEIVIYPNKYFYNRDLEKMIIKYYNNEYSGSANDFSKYVRNNYDDFSFSSDEQRNIYLTSTTRGIIITINDSISVELYKNYDNPEFLKQNMSENVQESEKYMVEVMEIERNWGQ